MAYYQGGSTTIPMPEHFHHQGFPQPPPDSYSWPPPYYQQLPYSHNAYQQPPYSHNSDQQQAYQQQPHQQSFYQQPSHQQYQAPPLPPKPPTQAVWNAPPSPQPQQVRPPLPPRPHSSIEPDPLPPHSNPQQLSTTQSLAYQGPQPIQPVKLTKHEVLNPMTAATLFSVSREAVHMPSSLSSKPLLTVSRSTNGLPIGTIRFHSLSTSDIDMTINGRFTAIKRDGFMHNRFAYHPTTIPNGGDTWYWVKDKANKGIMLTDAKKHGNVMARMKIDVLSFERAMAAETADEIILSACALAEYARREKKNGEVADIAGAIGDATASIAGAAGGAGA